MAETTSISWTNHTWNPWRGCTMISPGCANCYMFTAQRRYGRDPSVVVRTKTWNDPYRWDQQAKAKGTQERVFTCSWSDFFHPTADPWRDDAWKVIQDCPHLIFQVLTKRAERIQGSLPADWGQGYDNAWLGVSVENDRYVWRADVLRAIPARVRFISAEPLLGPLPSLDLAGIHWLIAGGESGPGYRSMDLDWARDLRDRAKAAGVAFFFKQSADLHPERGTDLDGREWKEFP